MSNSSISPLDRTNLGQSVPRSNVNKEVLHIPQSSSFTRASPSECLVSYPGHLFFLPLCRDAVSVFDGSSQLGYIFLGANIWTLAHLSIVTEKLLVYKPYIFNKCMQNDDLALNSQ